MDDPISEPETCPMTCPVPMSAYPLVPRQGWPEIADADSEDAFMRSFVYALIQHTSIPTFVMDTLAFNGWATALRAGHAVAPLVVNLLVMRDASRVLDTTFPKDAVTVMRLTARIRLYVAAKICFTSKLLEAALTLRLVSEVNVLANAGVRFTPKALALAWEMEPEYSEKATILSLQV